MTLGRMWTMYQKPYKTRKKSAELRCMESLYNRMTLSDKDQQHFLNLSKGYEGEVMFDSLTERLNCECLIVNDLLLQVNNTTFQIDSLIFKPEQVYLYEVKNFDGDYFFEGNRFYKTPKQEYTNPLHQLERTESLLRQLFKNLGYNFRIESSVVFINPEFTLYQAPFDKPLILPTQLQRYLKSLDTISTKISGKLKILADKLISLHLDKSPYSQVPPYCFDYLKKGITCANCSSLSVILEGRTCVCIDCGNREKVASAVLRCVEEFKLLFPEQKITTKTIYEWCGGIISKKWIGSILGENFKMIGSRQWTYYVES